MNVARCAPQALKSNHTSTGYFVIRQPLAKNYFVPNLIKWYLNVTLIIQMSFHTNSLI